jgi:hypothetical protein
MPKVNITIPQAATDETRVDHANVVCQVIRTDDLQSKGLIELRWSQKGGFFRPYAVDAGNLKSMIDKVRKAIGDIVNEHLSDDLLDPQYKLEHLPPLCAQLASDGAGLHTALFSTDDAGRPTANIVKKWLGELTAAGQIETLEILIEDACADSKFGPLAAIPWNLVYDETRTHKQLTEAFRANLDKPAAGGEAWLPFWGVRYDLCCGRNVNPLKRDALITPDKASVLVVFDREIKERVEASIAADHIGEGDPESYRTVVDEIETAGIKVREVNTRKDLEEDLLTYGPPDILYWLSHAEPEALHLDVPITLIELQNLFEKAQGRNSERASHGTIAFFNGCETAIAAEKGSFLQSITDKDLFTGLIGTENETIDVYAHRFGLRFLKGFLTQRKPVGRLLRGLRRSSVPLGLLYGTYCPPMIRVAPLPISNDVPESTSDISVVTDRSGPSLKKLSSKVPALNPANPIDRDLIAVFEDDAGYTAEHPFAKSRDLPEWPAKPYPSLGFYTLKDQSLFLGREDDSARLAELVDTPQVRLLLLHGTSGSGKSSVIRAGLVPYLETYAVGYRFLRRPETAGIGESEQLHLFFRPSNDFVGRLAGDLLTFTAEPYPLEPRPDGKPQSPVPLRPLLAACVDPAKADVTHAELKSALENPKQADLLCRILDALTASIPEKLVVTIDQAEELYTLAPSGTPDEIQKGEADRKQAFAQLRGCLRGSGRWKVLLSYRTEYHGRITDALRTGLRATPGIADYLITDLGKAQLKIVIERPTLDFPVVEGLISPRQKYGFVYEDGVVDEIVGGIFRLRGRNTDSVLPIAQVVCTQLYEQVRAKAANADTMATITQAMFDAVQASALHVKSPALESSEKTGVRSGANVGDIRRNKDLAGEPVLNILVKYSENVLAEVAGTGKRTPIERFVSRIGRIAPHLAMLITALFSTRIKSLKEMIMKLYDRQPDGSLTSRELFRDYVRREHWKGTEKDFDSAIGVAVRSRLLREESAQGAKETEEATIRLGHDALCKVADRWMVQKTKRNSQFKYALGAALIMGLSALGVHSMVLLSKNRDLQTKQEEIDRQNVDLGVANKKLKQSVIDLTNSETKAREEEVEAVKQKGLAVEQRTKAKRNEEIAKRNETEATKAKLDAATQRDLAESREIVARQYIDRLSQIVRTKEELSKSPTARIDLIRTLQSFNQDLMTALEKSGTENLAVAKALADRSKELGESLDEITVSNDRNGYRSAIDYLEKASKLYLGILESIKSGKNVDPKITKNEVNRAISDVDYRIGNIHLMRMAKLPDAVLATELQEASEHYRQSIALREKLIVESQGRRPRQISLARIALI